HVLRDTQLETKLSVWTQPDTQREAKFSVWTQPDTRVENKFSVGTQPDVKRKFLVFFCAAPSATRVIFAIFRAPVRGNIVKIKRAAIRAAQKNTKNFRFTSGSVPTLKFRFALGVGLRPHAKFGFELGVALRPHA
ncbi:MAG: hypothetical protein GY820_03130, partial [Gammaproteobacteria bacterium]|nr:hypothetical protein [Gammaproteobacteria bacterium]